MSPRAFMHRYAPEPLNTSSALDAQIAQGVAQFVSSADLTGAVVPNSIPQNVIMNPLITDLPNIVLDGDIVSFVADDARGIVWRLRYQDGGGDYPWSLIGGAPLVADVVTDQGTSGTSYGDLTTAGPSVTVPLAGDYTIAFGAHSYSSGAGTNYVSPYLGAAATDGNASQVDFTAGSKLACQVRTLPSTTLKAGDLVNLQYKVASGSGQFRNRWLTVMPIRVAAR